MEPKLRFKTALATLDKCQVYMRTDSGIFACSGYMFDIYLDGKQWFCGVYTRKNARTWYVTDLYTGLLISRKGYGTRREALESFFNNEFRPYSIMITRDVLCKAESWYRESAYKFACEAFDTMGYIVPEIPY